MNKIIVKSLRSIWRRKKSYASSILVLSLGIMIFICMLSIMDQIQKGIDRYYNESQFADVFATLSAYPDAKLEELTEIKGVALAAGVLSKDVKVSLPDSDLMVRVHLVGIKPIAETSLNKYTFSGTDLKLKNDIWLGKDFYRHYNMKQGGTLTLIINGNKKEFNVNGTVQSPEHIYTVADSEFMADPETYTIGFVQADALEEFLSLEGIVTELSFALEDGYSFSEVKGALAEKLKPYGLIKLYERKTQTSNQYLNDEIGTLEIMGTILPVIFLSITVIMIYIMLKRIVEQDRGEIGTLKAFGFSNTQIIGGYLINGGVIGIISFVAGLLLSFPFGEYMYSYYQSQYALPDPSYVFSATVSMWAFLTALAVSIISVCLGVYGVLHINPAEAMRPEAPAVSGGSFKFNHKALLMLLDRRGIMALRSMSRNYVRSMLIVISIVFSFAIINVIIAMNESTESIMRDQTKIAETYDLKVNLEKAQPLSSILNEVEKIDGVLEKEGILVLPVKIINKNLSKDMAIHGLNRSSNLFKIRDTKNRFYQPPTSGILLNTIIAKKLNVVEGDLVELESPYLKDNVMVSVNKIIDEPRGSGSYMEINGLSKLFQAETGANTILISAKQDKIREIQDRMLKSANVLSITNQAHAEKLNEDYLESLSVMIYMFVIMTFLMGFGAIYNVSRISLDEKKRELATMKILGFTTVEVSQINSFEQWIYLVVGVIAGFLPAILLKNFMENMFSTIDYYTMDIILSWKSSIFALVSCVLAVALSNVIARREISKYELAEVLKERE